MMKKNTGIFFAIAYTFTTLLALNLVFLLKQHAVMIIILYLGAILLLAIHNIILNHNLKKRKTKFDKETISQLLDNVNAMTIVWDPSFSDIIVNSNLIAATGYSKKECQNIDILKKILPKEAFNANDYDILTDTKDVECMVHSKDGTEILTIWHTSIIPTNSPIPVMISIGRDFSQIARMQQEFLACSKDLADSKNRYTLSMELSEIGIILRKIDSDYFFVSSQLKSMLAIHDDHINVEYLKKRVHPHDRVLFDRYCEATPANCETQKIHNIEMRILSQDNTYHWYAFRYKIAENSQGEAADIGGAMLDITRDKEKDSLIEKMAYIDEVTQIYNRNKFMIIGQETYGCSVALNISYWVIVIDIDKFHIINDTCGYQNGNILLKEVAITILKNLTAGGFGARIGGDNFALIIKDDGDDDFPIMTIKNIQALLSELTQGVFSNQTLSCSAGYCKMPCDGSDFAKILDHTEFALSLNDTSRGNIARYDSNMHDDIIAGNTLESELAKALDNNELVLYYQPKINLTTGVIFGMEALIRWVKPDGTIVPPNSFIPVAEKSMLITRISKFVIYEACRQNKKWQDMGMGKIAVSINLTSVDFYQTDVRESIHSALMETGLDPEWLEVELTESLALKDIDQAIHQMQAIKDLGVKLSMDDFGTGYSSLSYIQILPISLLKLDRSFIMYLEEDKVSREIVSAVIKIAKSKNIETIAEGIETIGQADILRSSGCDHAQGYFFGRPMTPDNFEEFIRNKSLTTV